jgi:alkylhydroperoxidase/carboxymuconolactone decarboxylase family protein YurZ
MMPAENDQQDEQHLRLKQEFIDARGYWNPVWDQLINVAPEFFQAYSDLSSAPWKHGTIPPKYKELIYIALDASPTHLYEPGLRIHIRNALRLGATRHEIAEVLQLCATVGIHACTVGIPILFDEDDRQNMKRDPTPPKEAAGSLPPLPDAEGSS